MVEVRQLGQWSVNLLGPLGDHFVISPGSRSTALVVAAHRLCQLDERWQHHLIVDERSAGFYALGLAKSGKRAVLLCTSGSALAHYFPALLEASAAALPLAVVSADRPPRLHGCGANQTIDQQSFFGTHVRGFFDAGEPSPGALAQVLSLSMQARKRAEGDGGLPGPVHINAPFGKPLEPDDEVEEAPPRFDLVQLRTHRSRALDAKEWPERFRAAERPVVIAGPTHRALHSVPRDQVFERLTELCIPLLAERTSALTSQSSLPLDPLLRSLVRNPSSDFAPDLIVQVGTTPTSKFYGAWIESLGSSVTRIVVAEQGLQDPWRNVGECAAEGALVGAETTLLSLLLGETQLRRTPSWQASWKERSEQTLRKIAEVRKTFDEGEGVLAGAILRGMNKRGRLVIGNSLPVRLLETWAGAMRTDVQVVSRRGVSGIDGLVATAAGVVQASRKPAVLWLGDLSLLHDIGSLPLCSALPAPLVIVVANNHGGRIFEQLPVAQHAQTKPKIEMWTTPHRWEFAHVARQFDLRYARADASGLENCVRESLAQKGASLVEVVVPPGSAAEAERALAASGL